MTAEILYGKPCADQLKLVLIDSVGTLKKRGVFPKLTVILVGHDPGSEIYVRNKEKACQEIGILSTVVRLPSATSENELLSHIEHVNQDITVHGLLVQLPIPSHINEKKIISAISPVKDVDGFHPLNVGKWMSGDASGFVSCTPAGIIYLLKKSNITLVGKHAVVVGRSHNVGKPLAFLLLNNDATVTIAHSRTLDLATITTHADILIAAVGQPQLITAEMVKPGAIVIDVGINRTAAGLVGDVDFKSVSMIASKITPVPGGVGLLTVAMLMQNCVQAATQINEWRLV